MIDNRPPLPDGMAYTSAVTQAHLDECSRALNRPLYDFEVRVLDDMLTRLAKYNRKVAKKGLAMHQHSMDQLVSIFVERVHHAQADAMAKKLIYEQLGRSANRT